MSLFLGNEQVYGVTTGDAAVVINGVDNDELVNALDTHNADESAHSDIRTLINGKADEGHTHTPASIGAPTVAEMEAAIASIPTPDVSGRINEHNTSTSAHNDIRIEVNDLNTRLTALANSDDTTLDQMAEVVEYIKDNRDLIDQVTTGKVGVSDIVDNLTTNVANKPLSAAQGVALKASLDECFTSVSEGKSLIAAAVADMGVQTAANNTFAEMATNVKKISTDATASAGEILSGETAYVNGAKITGTMANQGAKTASLNCGGSYTIPAGYHNGSGKVTANSLASQTSATAVAGDIASGKTAYVNGSLVTGTAAINGGVKTTKSGTLSVSTGMGDRTTTVTIDKNVEIISISCYTNQQTKYGQFKKAVYNKSTGVITFTIYNLSSQEYATMSYTIEYYK